MKRPLLLLPLSLLALSCGQKGVLPDGGLPDVPIGEGPVGTDGEILDVPEPADTGPIDRPPNTMCPTAPASAMTFFVTEQGNLTGNLGGLTGADAICQSAAEDAGIQGKTWRAYLSSEADPTFGRVDAKDRIGAGPWLNAAALSVGDNAAIHGAAGIANNLILTECGRTVVYNVNDPTGNDGAHDALTGSTPTGELERLVDPNTGTRDGPAATCADWTSSSANDMAMLGHTDWDGAADSWNWAHDSNGCDETSLRSTGSIARIYCFAID